jgi:hypothetical protein
MTGSLPPYGLRETRITSKKKPTGWVAFCNLCTWSTGIFVTSEGELGETLADTKLRWHLKSDTHKLRTASLRDVPVQTPLV